ncbi:MAG TPA: CAP domain-containing protein [Candidatus Sulfotelmatobacter sp.]|nr:CAP domain-containing protein [Candidatus Sulfotelmatobacter sp.]
MHRAPRLLLAFLLGTGVATVQPAVRLMASSADGPGSSSRPDQATLKPASARSADIPFIQAESQVEEEMLQLANQSRQKAGVGPLTLDAGLSQAARVHAMAMLEAHQLSHQFAGEPDLPERLASMTKLQLDQEGENVALDYSATGGHAHLMLSPPHRANLLNAAYNVVGLGVVRSGDRLYIVQDFAHAVASYSTDDVKEKVAAAVTQLRRSAHVRELPRHDVPQADEYACSMAHADKLGTAPVQKLAKQFTVLTYTSLHPESLPGAANHAITSRNLRSFSVGACYARTESYPTGVYWIVLSLD